MEVLYYNDLDVKKVKKVFDKTIKYLKGGDFNAADVKKMPDTGYYRAKLDDTNRLLFRIGEIEGKKYLFILEVILNHAYDKSRFLNGKKVDESKLRSVENEQSVSKEELAQVAYVNPKNATFNYLDKIISFDDAQSEVLNQPTPLIIIGSAGSGKTALTLEKIKTLKGRILYITLSPYLAENSRNLYYAHNYNNEDQEVYFLSLYEYLSGIAVPKGKEVDFRAFEKWIWRFKQAYKIQDAYKVFEEFKGVITGSVDDKPYLTKDEYISLGVRQSIFGLEEREKVYELFLKYLDFLKEGNYFDSNLVAYDYLSKVEPYYDFVVVDEVQDITLVQLAVIRRSLIRPTDFILCGDSNQIVHPNFFSWSQIKTAFYLEDLSSNIIRILATNYRNTPEVTQIANKLLLVKNARFGSIDRESTYLVQPNSKHQGIVEFLENKAAIRDILNKRTKGSAKVAVLVMRNEDKAEAAKYFETPLLFSVQEAKGLEYESIILFDIISSYTKEFRELTAGISPEDLEGEIHYSRAKSKSDKSLDEYKFYVNSLYVAITRAVKNLYVIESNKKHDLLALLSLIDFKEQVSASQEQSSHDEWQQEARRLERQGKKEQADAIRKKVLKQEPVPWEIITRSTLDEVVAQALNPDHFNKKAKDRLFEYALYYGEIQYFDELAELKYKRAEKGLQELPSLERRLFAPYAQDNIKPLLPGLDKWGLDYRNEFNLTPFMLAITYGAMQIATYLIENGANTSLTDNYGRNPLQLAIHKSYLEKSRRGALLNRFYDLLKTETIRVKVDNRLVKIDSHQGEYLMLNFMLATLSYKMQMGLGKMKQYDLNHTYQTADFMQFYEDLDENVIPEFRKKRTYISSILSKNEIYRDDKYNKRLFLRTNMGNYLPNPSMEIEIEENWHNVYDLADHTNLDKSPYNYSKAISNLIKKYRGVGS